MALILNEMRPNPRYFIIEHVINVESIYSLERRKLFQTFLRKI